MDAVIGIVLVVGLLVLKIVLMRAVWKMAGEQGRSQWLCLIASLFAVLIVFLALWMSGRERKQWAQAEEQESKSAIE